MKPSVSLRVVTAAIVGAVAFFLVAPSAWATPGEFGLKCASCHFDDTPTCSGCHVHVVGGLHADTDKAQYAPGETIVITLSTPWNWPGWLRAVLYDETMVEVDRVTGPTGTGDDGSGDTALQLPVALSASAPLLPGTYTWTVGWFGNNASASGHLEDLVTTNQFQVSGTPPSTTTTTTTTSTSSTNTTISTVTSTTSTSTSTTTSTTMPPPGAALDHFLCYKTKLKQSISVDLSDQFDSGTYTSKGAKLFCTPADKNGEGITDPNTHLLSYKLNGPHQKQTNVEVVDQFGTFFYNTKKTDSLMVPTAKSLIPDPPPGLPDPDSLVDHYRCVKVKRSKGTPKFPKGISVRVAGQFGTRTFLVNKPSRLCLPVDKNGEGIKDPNAHLMCYGVKSARKVCAADAPDHPGSGCKKEEDCGGTRRETTFCVKQPKSQGVTGVQINNQFGAATIVLKKEAELCLPARKNPAKVNPGDPVLPPAAGFVGSEECRSCHEQKYWGWIGTLHRLPIRDTTEAGLTGKAVVADSDGDGIDDFKTGTDLGTAPNATAFAVYGSNAPVLGFDPTRVDPNSGEMGVYTITIGPISYDITRTHGGNGYWKQRYQTKIGDNYYYMPVQYNEVTNEYVVYHGSDWYDGSNNPLYTNPATLADDIDKQDAYGRKCVGCHNTGVDVQFDANGQWVTGYVELGIGCEDCHGPGAAHVASADPDDIINPDELSQCDGDLVGGDGIKDGTCRISGTPCDAGPFPGAASPDCLVRVNEVCGRCHSRGSSTLTLGGSTLGYPGKDAGDGSFQNFNPGDTLADFYNFTSETKRYWGLNQVFSGLGHDVGYTPDSYVASKSHHQQYFDLLISPHAPDQFYDPTCYSCHDMHGSSNEHLIVDNIEEDGVNIATQVDDNSLCLACHATHGPFAAVTKEQVAEIGSGSTPAAIEQAVLDHMAEEAGMGGAYDPLGTGVGRCTSCHLPKLAKSAIYGTDAEGHTTGDITAHVFTIIWPSVNERLTGGDENMSNSCTGCHTTSAATAGHDLELFEWAKSGHADLTERHWRYSAGPSRAACVRCHSANGFVDFLAGVPEVDRNTDPKMHTCYACHDGTPGNLHARRLVTDVTFPSGELVSEGGDSMICMNCHQGRKSTADVDNYLAGNPDPISFSAVNPHYLPAGATLFGSQVHGGYEYSGKSYIARSPHVTATSKYCVQCHLSRTTGSDEVGGHTMAMAAAGQENTSGCGCHFSQPSLDNFRDPFSGAVDYDGDGDTTEGIKGEIQTMLDDLLIALTNAGITCTDSYPYCSGWNGTAAEKASQVEAAYNYRFLLRDPGAYAHNGLYALQLLHDSYADLTGGAHAGTRP